MHILPSSPSHSDSKNTQNDPFDLALKGAFAQDNAGLHLHDNDGRDLDGLDGLDDFDDFAGGGGPDCDAVGGLSEREEMALLLDSTLESDGLVHDVDARNMAEGLETSFPLGLDDGSGQCDQNPLAKAANAPYSLIDEPDRQLQDCPVYQMLPRPKPVDPGAHAQHDPWINAIPSTQAKTMNPSKPNVVALTKEISDAMKNGIDLSLDGGAVPGSLAQKSNGLDPAALARIEEFWDWFNQREAAIYGVELDKMGTVAEEHMDTIVALAEACAKIHEDLSVEIEEAGNDGVRTLVISANGITDVFPFVEEVVDRARTSERWKVVKYRQRQSQINSLSLKGHTLRPTDVQFGIARHIPTGQFGVYVFIPGFSQEELDIWRHLGFIFLDLALGEFDVATKITSVEFDDIDALPHVNRISISELPGVFDYLFKKARH